MASRPDDEARRGTRSSLPSELSALIREIADGGDPGKGDGWDDLLAPGVVVGRFEMVREVGRGGFGIVYEARDRVLGRPVAFKALKVRPSGERAPERILHEAEVAAGLSHPNIATLFDVGSADERPFLVFEFLSGVTLHKRLKGGGVTPEEALRIGLEAARGIAYAHANGVVHRDLTPANVFLCADGQVKILDLGMAHAFGRRPVAGGTPGYMAPEQVRGGPEDERTDVFGLGVLLYRMLTGEAPFPDGASLSRAAPSIDVPGQPGLGEAVGKMLALDPVDRPRDGGAVLAELTRIRVELGARTPPEARTRVRKRRRMASLPVAGAMTVALAAVGIAWLLDLYPSRARAASHPSVASVAVLPFADLSAQHDQKYFSDGISEEILSRLSRVEGIRVPGRTSTFRARGEHASLAELGRELGVSAILDGSVRLDGRRIRVSAQVISLSDGLPLWAGSFDRELTEVFAVQDEIASAVVDSLRVKLLAGGGAAAARYATTSPEAYRHYLRAREQFTRYTIPSIQEAVNAYRLALEADPRYAPAWAGIAVPLFLLASRAETPEAVQAGRKGAREAAEKALAIAPDLPEALVARGTIRLWMDRDRRGALRDVERAVELDGGNPDTRRRYANLLGSSGRLDEAVEQARIAADLDPYGLSTGALGKLHQARGELDLAETWLRRHLRMEPDNLPARLMLGQNQLLQGKPEEALATFQSVPDESYRLWGIAMALHALGRGAESSAALARLADRYRNEKAFEVATVHAWRGETEEAFAWLERALEQGETRMTGMDAMEPLLRSIRGDPRFRDLVARAETPAR